MTLAAQSSEALKASDANLPPELFEQTPDHVELEFVDPATEAFAEAVRLPPLALARWAFASIWQSVRGLIV